MFEYLYIVGMLRLKKKKKSKALVHQEVTWTKETKQPQKNSNEIKNHEIYGASIRYKVQPFASSRNHVICVIPNIYTVQL